MLWSVCGEVMWRSTAYGFVLRKLVARLSICFHRYVMIPHNVWRNHRSGTTHICTCENSYLGPCALVSEITNALVFSAQGLQQQLSQVRETLCWCSSLNPGDCCISLNKCHFECSPPSNSSYTISLGMGRYNRRESKGGYTIVERVWEGGCTMGESLGRRLYQGRESRKEAVLWERVWE